LLLCGGISAALFTFTVDGFLLRFFCLAGSFWWCLPGLLLAEFQLGGLFSSAMLGHCPLDMLFCCCLGAMMLDMLCSSAFFFFFYQMLEVYRSKR
jgi:hypothetical protein